MFSSMRHHPTRRATAAALLFVLLAGGCAHARRTSPPLGRDVVYPAWVLAGSRFESDGGARSIVGVGQIDGMRNVALARATADNRARAELARVLEVYLGALLAALPTAPPQAPAAVQANPPVSASAAADAGLRPDANAQAHAQELAAKLMLAAALPSVQIVDRWFHPDRGAVFSLARLDLEEMRDGLSRLHELSEESQSALLAALDATHQRLCAAQAQRPVR